MTEANIKNNECAIVPNRQFALDILKVVAMIMVITTHFPLGIESDFGSAQYNIRAFFVSFSYCAVNVYALISGYCLVGKKTYFSRVINLWIIVLFYSVVNLLLNAIIFDKFSAKSLILAILPILSDEFWYATGYIVLYLFVPFINILMDNLSFRNTKKLVFLLLFTFGIGSWISQRLGGSTLGVNSGYSVIWLMIMFIVGAAIKKYGVRVVSIFNKEHNNVWYIVIALCSGLCVFASEYIFYYISGLLLSAPQPFKLLYGYCSPFIIVMSISLFVFFSKLKINTSKGIKFFTVLSSFSFSTYIIHSCDSFRELVWNILFEKYNGCFLVEFLSDILLTLLICVIIEYIRQKTFDRLRTLVIRKSL